MMAQDPAAMPADDGATAGYEICIKVDGSGAIMVGVEPEGAEPTDDSGMQPVKNIKEACAIVMDIFKNSGQITDQGEGDFEAGFGAKPPMGNM